MAAEDVLPLTEFENYHWAGLRVSVTRENGKWFVYTETAEKDKGILNFIDYSGMKTRLEIFKTGVKQVIEAK